TPAGRSATPFAVAGAAGAAERIPTDVGVLAVPTAGDGGSTAALPAAPPAAALLLAVDGETTRRLGGAAGQWTGVVLRS
ncbi:hypothetical protein, partial [Kineococcus glutinatus]|uniref:hypothetical protein n=1 Tax=Kineococcus glutinatus TaxID=1070872 RepID=UPI003CD0A035